MSRCTVTHCSSLDLYNLTQNFTITKLIIDTRAAERYAQGRVKTAINFDLSDPSALQQLREGANLDGMLPNSNFRMRGLMFRRVIIYDEFDRTDEDREDAEEDAHALRSVANSFSAANSKFGPFTPSLRFDNSRPADVLAERLLLEGKVDQVDILQCGFDRFEARFPFLVSSDEQRAPSHEYPSQIINNFLFLGGRSMAESMDILKDLGITHVVNTAEEIPNFFESEFQYLNIGVGDTIQDSIDIHFERAYEFIEDARKEGGKVLVHCAMGISRSSTITISYLLRRYGLPLTQTMNFVKSRRTYILPNPGFVTQLQRLEASLSNPQE